MSEESKPIEVSRRIEAAAAPIFEILANPQRHMDFDGPDMLRGPSHLRRGRHLHHEGESARRRLPHVQLCGGVRARSAHLLGTRPRTEVFDYGTVTEDIRQSLLRDGGAWINGTIRCLSP
jgi:hypothetical protein